MLYHKIIKNPKNKEWVVFIHGIGGGSSIWFKQVKDFSRKYNLLFIDLPGHGKSTYGLKDLRNYNFYDIANEVIQVLDNLNIDKAHFVGVSLGTIIIQVMNYIKPQKVKKMVLAGAVERLNIFAKLICKIAFPIKNIVPYMLIYKMSAWILMPRKRHKESREAFIKEAIKLGQEEFVCWYSLNNLVNRTIEIIKRKETSRSPNKLYIMGEEDYVFLPFIKKAVKRTGNGTLKIIEKCGHVCNVEKPLEFNKTALAFLN